MLKDLLKQRSELEERMKALQEDMQAVNIDIEHVLAQRLHDARQIMGKEYGVVNLVLDGIKVTETVPQKVEWDQEKMLALHDAIAQAGDNPRNYMKVKLEVAEKAFADFVPEVKAMFSDCRTVKPGKAQLKFEEVTNA